MPRRRPRTAPPTLSSSLISLLLLAPLIAAAPQQQPHNGIILPHEVVDTISPDSHDRVSRTPHQKQNPPIAVRNERAIATLPSAPAASLAAVREPSIIATSGGPSRLESARNLDNWKVEDFVLLATVDGQIHARDRETGQERWSFHVGRPMVETTYNSNRSSDPNTQAGAMPFVWIVEPSQNGNIYVYLPSDNTMQKMDMTVQELAEMSPLATEHPAVVYTAEKKTTLYTIDARTGNVLRRFSSGGSNTFNNTNCELRTGFESSNRECTGSLTLGQIEYTVSVQDRDTGENICTIKYFEWSPNKKDNDLYSQYQETKDNKFVYSKYDGTVFAVDHTNYNKIYPQRPVYTRKFSSPVVRVFDVARPEEDDSADPPLVLLPQPQSKMEHEAKDIWVNCTESGSWYAMSEFHYPTVTDGASVAQCYSKSDLATWDHNFGFSPKKALVGVHAIQFNDYAHLAVPNPTPKFPTIDPGESGESNKQDPVVVNPPQIEMPPIDRQSQQRMTWSIVVLFLVIPLLTTVLAPDSVKQTTKDMVRKLQGKMNKNSKGSETVSLSEAEQPVSAEPMSISEDGDERRVRFTLQNEKQDGEVIVLPGNSNTSLQTSPGEAVESPNTPDVEMNGGQADGSPESKPTTEEAEADVDATPKKKKAHRGQRGGKKRRKNTKTGSDDVDQDEITKIVEQAKNVEQTNGLQPDEISPVGQVMSDPSGVIQLGKLTINTDRILGNGSGGTFVFEGKWKEREVAVKRMLPQYFGLAEQEVSLLQQSDLHPNVIRYFDDERDQNFLYIAVELCQSSLWDLYRDGRGDEPLTDDQTKLVTQINSDVPRALYQLAAGLNHLHSLRIIHRDIKPQNILIAYPQKNQKGGPRLVISDFGLCKTLPDNVSTLVGTTGNAGTIGWKAPELILQPKENERNSSTGHSRESQSSTDPVAQGVKRAVDIFSLGCVFFYVLTNGSHPFDDEEGWMQIRELNIKKNIRNFSRLDYLGADIEEPIDLLKWMLSPEPETRPTAMQVMQHPFFWSAEKRLAFLCDASDHWEREPRDPVSFHLELLERHAEDIIKDPNFPSRPCDFFLRLDKKFTDTLGKQRKYTGNRLLDLLRALRNKKNHYEDMPPDVKARVGSLPDGYLAYWTNRFPKLLIECYKCVMECGLQEEPRFRPYFTEQS